MYPVVPLVEVPGWKALDLGPALKHHGNPQSSEEVTNITVTKLNVIIMVTTTKALFFLVLTMSQALCETVYMISSHS